MPGLCCISMVDGFSRIACALIAALWLLPAVGKERLRVRDDVGREVVVAVPVTRIVALAPHLAEMVFAAGAGDRLVGVSSATDYPPEVRRLPIVGTAGRADVERVLRLEPDLVLAWASGGHGSDIERLRRLGVPVLLWEVRRLDDLPRQVETLGKLAGTLDEATRAAHALRRGFDELSARWSRGRPIAVFLPLWLAPLMTVGSDHYLDEVLRLCGARNVFAQARPGVFTVAPEAVLAARPEVVVTSGRPEEKNRVIENWRGDARLSALEARYVFVDADLLHRPGPRLLMGARALCAALHAP